MEQRDIIKKKLNNAIFLIKTLLFNWIRFFFSSNPLLENEFYRIWKISFYFSLTLYVVYYDLNAVTDERNWNITNILKPVHF